MAVSAWSLILRLLSRLGLAQDQTLQQYISSKFEADPRSARLAQRVKLRRPEMKDQQLQKH